MTIMETASGRLVDIVDPDWRSIHIKDIAHHLARLARFVGATRGEHGYSVAQHSLWVADYLLRATGNPETALHGLLHDAHEAYMGDASTPLKSVPGFRDIYGPLAEHLQRLIHAALDLPHPGVERRTLIKTADLQAAATEASFHMPSLGCGAHWGDLPRIDDIAARTNAGLAPDVIQSPLMAEAGFMNAYQHLRDAATRMPDWPGEPVLEGQA